MFENLKKKVRKKVVLFATCALTIVASCVPVLAEDSGLASVETALTTSFTSVATSMTSIVGKILPIALPVMGALLLVTFGIKAFKKIANKA